MKSILAISFCSTFITSVLSSPWGPAPKAPAKHGKTCTVKALGGEKDDTPQILKAFEECNNGGTVVFPEDQNYWIATKLNPVIHDVTVEWKGIWTVRLLSYDTLIWAVTDIPLAFRRSRLLAK